MADHVLRSHPAGFSRLPAALPVTPGRPVLAAFALGLAAALGYYAITPAGIGITADSVTYLDAATRFARGEGMVAYHERGVSPLTHFPPLYPWLLSWFVRAGVTAETGARVLTGIAGAGTAAFLVTLLARMTRSVSAAVVLAAGLLMSRGFVRIHAAAWSEALFLVLFAALLYCVYAFITHSRPVLLMLAAFCAGLASLTRYAGVVFIAYVCLLALHRWRSGTLRPAHVLAVWSMAASPLLFWLWRNRQVEEFATSRSFQLDPPRIAELGLWLRTFGTWLLPVAPFAAHLALGALLIAASAMLLASRRCRAAPAIAQHAFGLLWAYVLFVLGARLLLDRWIVFDLRMAAPAFLLAIVAVAPFVTQHTRFTRLLRTCAAVWLLLTAAASAPLIGYGLQYGWGIEAPGWRALQLEQLLASLPNQGVYSNVPHALYYHTGVAALSLPRATFGDDGRLTDEPIPFARVLDDVRAGGATVVFVDGPEYSVVRRRLGEALALSRTWRPNVLVFSAP